MNFLPGVNPFKKEKYKLVIKYNLQVFTSVGKLNAVILGFLSCKYFETNEMVELRMSTNPKFFKFV